MRETVPLALLLEAAGLSEAELEGQAKEALSGARGRERRKKSLGTLTASNGASVEERAVRYLEKCDPAIDGQHGHNALLNAARAVVWGFDLGPEIGYRLLEAHYNPTCKPPWSEHDLRRKCSEADVVPFDKPRGWLLEEGKAAPGANGNGRATVPAARPSRKAVCPPVEDYVPFPVGHLPPPADRFVSEAAASIGCDPAFVALPALAALGAAVGNTRAVVLKKGWSEPAVLWAATIGESGCQKSPAYKAATDATFALQRKSLREHRAAVKRWKDDDGRPEDDPGPARRIVTSNTTVEKLAKLLAENPRGLFMCRDELNGWFNSFTRYKGTSTTSDVPDWIEMFKAGTLLIDRKTGDAPSLLVHPAAVWVCGTIQPGTLARALTAECLDSGLAARLLLAMPPRRKKKWSEAEIDPEVSDAWGAVLGALYGLNMPQARDGEVHPAYLGLSAGAKRLWVEWYDEWAEEQHLAEGELQSAFAKLEAYAARLALCHHMTRLADLGSAPQTVPLAEDSMASGVALVRWFANETRRVYATLGDSDDTRASRRLLDWVRAQDGKATVRQLQRANCRRYPTAEEAQASLQALVDSGLGTWEDVPPPATGGHPSKQFVLRMTHDGRTLDGADEAPF